MAGTYELSLCSKRNAASVLLTMLGGGNTETVLGGKNLNFDFFDLMTIWDGGHMIKK